MFALQEKREPEGSRSSEPEAKNRVESPKARGDVQLDPNHDLDLRPHRSSSRSRRAADPKGLRWWPSSNG